MTGLAQAATAVEREQRLVDTGDVCCWDGLVRAERGHGRVDLRDALVAGVGDLLRA